MFAGIRARAVHLLLLVGAAPLAAHDGPTAGAPDVVVVVWNDPKLERLGFLGERERGVTEQLDAVFARGAVFTNASIVCPRGRPTSAAILTGRHAHQTGVFSQTVGKPIAPEATLGALFHAQGYATFFVGRFHEGSSEAFGFEGETKGVIQSGSSAVTAFVAGTPAERPLFALWSPEVPDGYGAKNLDQALGELLAALDARGRRANTLFGLVVNGELKADISRPREFASQECSPAGMRTVLAFAGVGVTASRRSLERAAPIDVLPTMLELARLSIPTDVAGRSLAPIVRGGTLEPRALGAAFYEPQPSGSKVAQALERNLKALVLFQEHYQYQLFLDDVGVEIDKETETAVIERSSGDQLLFDLEADPKAEHNLFLEPAQAPRVEAMRAALLAWWRASGGPEFTLPALSPLLGPPPKEPRPNLVLVIADDMDYEHLGFMGNPRVRTPTLDELAKTGVVYPVAHVPMSRCRPSLAVLLSGRWPQETGIFENETTHTLTRRDSLPNLLKAAGYATFQGGKFWEGSHFSMGFLAPETIDTAMKRFVREGQDELFRFIDRYHDERPLFLWWAPMLPHKPFDPPERLRQLFRDTEVPVPTTMEGDAQEYIEAERTSYAMGAWLDEGLAALRAKLAAVGELENTLFVFLIDNGHCNGFPSKGTVFEKGMRTPLVVSWPKSIAAGRRDELVYTIDVYKTMLDYAGVSAPSTARGASLRPSLEGTAHTLRAALYGAGYTFREQGRAPRPETSVYALYARTPRWKFVHYLKEIGPAAFPFAHEFAPFPAAARGSTVLFDLEQDPYEQHDLSADPTHAALLAELEAGALVWWREAGGEELDLGAETGDTQGRKNRKRKQDR